MRAALLASALVACGAVAQVEPRVLYDGIVHLGDTRVETWPAGTPDPVGRVLEFTFEGTRNRGEHCLVVAHHDADDPWTFEINGAPAFELVRGKELRDHVYVLPPGTLRDGENRVRVAAREGSYDDILVGDVRLLAQPLREHLDLRVLEVAVADDRGRPIPARVTVTDPAGELVEVYYAATDRTAVRKGVVYAADGVAALELPAGEYVVWAGRGMEWGVDSERVVAGGADRVELAIAREVDTTGYVACDTHLHTYTFSGHGDATVEERIVTLAGEGVELAVATDHNHHTDYAPVQRALGLEAHYTTVVGNEVTTKNGHFNAFPLSASTPPPSWKLDDWVKLVEGIRAKGAQVVVLNHPRWPRIQAGPFGAEHFHLNRLSGGFENGPKITFDAIELVNATVDSRDALFTFVDWFALLNHGSTVRAVGTSDSHTVGDPVGQGRTYVRSETDDPAEIDVAAACAALKRGASSLAHGIFAEVWVGRAARMGDTVTVDGDTVSVALRVACASWVRPARALVYLNGIQVAELPVETPVGEPTDVTLAVDVPAPRHDAHLVCIVLGPGIRARHWRGDATNDWTLGATNPVFVDGDGDGHYTSPRDQARALVRASAGRAERLVEALAGYDDAVAIQALDLLHERLGADGRSEVEAAAFALERPLAVEFVHSLPD